MRLRSDPLTRALWRILAANLVVAGAKLAYALSVGTVALLADGIHSLLDASSTVVGLVGARLASRPPDAGHPYGHRKFEAFSALGISAALFVACARVATEALERLRAPRAPEIGPGGYALTAAAILISLAVTRYERRLGERLRSEVLLADAEHTRSDVWTGMLVLASFLAARAGMPWADVVAALAIVAIIAWAGVGIVRRAFATLADASRVPAEALEAAALSVPGVIECHEARSRGAAGAVHADLHVLVDPKLPIGRAHEIGHAVEAAVRRLHPDVVDVVVHVEPAVEGERRRALVDH